MKRPTPPRYLTEGFYAAGMDAYLHGRDEAPDSALRLFDDGPACWLFQFDDYERPCSGRLEVVHLIARQRIRNVLHPQIARLDFPDTILAEDVEAIVQQAEWDPRLARPGCEGHHRRFDSAIGPALKVPAAALADEALDCLSDHGLEAEAERKFAGAVIVPLPAGDTA